jgi:hypothetical protein
MGIALSIIITNSNIISYSTCYNVEDLSLVNQFLNKWRHDIDVQRGCYRKGL